MDSEYRKMMLWVLVALVIALLISFAAVEWTIRRYGP